MKMKKKMQNLLFSFSWQNKGKKKNEKKNILSLSLFFSTYSPALYISNARLGRELDVLGTPPPQSPQQSREIRRGSFSVLGRARHGVEADVFGLRERRARHAQRRDVRARDRTHRALQEVVVDAHDELALSPGLVDESSGVDNAGLDFPSPGPMVLRKFSGWGVFLFFVLCICVSVSV